MHESCFLVQDALIDKLKSKNHSLRTQIIKTDGRMKQKDQAGEGLHPIDLAQLKIENTQYNEKVELEYVIKSAHFFVTDTILLGSCELVLRRPCHCAQ